MSARGRPRGEPIVDAAAAISLVLGSALVFAPTTVSQLVGLAAEPRTLRAIGIADLALAPGLYLGRPQWPWMLARAAANPVIAAVFASSARSARARVVAAGLIGATALDLRTAVALRAAGR